LLSERFPWPRVSVILPVYNHADMVEQAANSVLYGSYDNFELILIDDGSTDDIDPALQRLLNNPRVRIFRQPNQKLPRALTHGHQQARGELVTWLSADNLMAENAIETMVRALLAKPEAVMVYADVRLIDDQGEPMVEGSYRPQNLIHLM
jgi:glycosyltransferase involved in cell wall biosynthesis